MHGPRLSPLVVRLHGQPGRRRHRAVPGPGHHAGRRRRVGRRLQETCRDVRPADAVPAGSLGVVPTFACRPPFRPPLPKPTRKRGRTANADLNNMSALSRKKLAPRQVGRPRRQRGDGQTRGAAGRSVWGSTAGMATTTTARRSCTSPRCMARGLSWRPMSLDTLDEYEPVRRANRMTERRGACGDRDDSPNLSMNESTIVPSCAPNS